MRKPTIKSLRAGQTIFWPSFDFRRAGCDFRVCYIVVGSDKLPDPEPNVKHLVLPRRVVADSIRRGTCPPYMSYSRRYAERIAKRLNGGA